MCQIIEISGNKNGVLPYLIENKSKIKKSLDFKGGEGYSFTMIQKDKITLVSKTLENFDKEYDNFVLKVTEEILQNNKYELDYLRIILFSRQRPEMEKSIVSLPPYSNNEKMVWMHGTISNTKEIEEKYNVKLEVDSKAFLYENPKNIKGVYTTFIYEKDAFMHYYDNGLGLYTFLYNGVKIKTTDINYTERDEINIKDYSDVLFVSYSGGMDISLSTYKLIKDNDYKIIYLNYFNYGARAQAEEIFALNNFQDFLKKEFPKKTIFAEVIDVVGIIKDISMIYDRKIKLIDKNSTADEKEAESNLAYIPYRNTLFAEMLAIKAEGIGYKNVDFAFGLNLSEGMVYLDNSEIWLDKINNLINRAGKDFTNYQILAPYYNKTKINMIKDFSKEFEGDKINEILNISFSCYYPDENGNACGKCGSCLLRQKAEEVAFQETKEMKEESLKI